MVEALVSPLNLAEGKRLAGARSSGALVLQHQRENLSAPPASQRTARRYQLKRAAKSLLFKDVGNHFPRYTSPTPWNICRVAQADTLCLAALTSGSAQHTFQ